MSTLINRNYQQRSGKPICGFCRRNKEPEDVYSSHQVKDDKGRVTCPQLFKYRCELCGATGEEAHTRSYCPSVRQFQRRQSPVNERKRRTNSSSSSSNRDSESHYQSSDEIFNNQQQEEASFSIHLGSDRMFRNMRGVTSTRYNSAGKLRKPMFSRQTQQQQAQQQQQTNGFIASIPQSNYHYRQSTYNGYQNY